MNSLRRILLAVSLGAIACGLAGASIIDLGNGFTEVTTAAIPLTLGPGATSGALVFPATAVPDNSYLLFAYLEVDDAEKALYDSTGFDGTFPFSTYVIGWNREVYIYSNDDDQTLAGAATHPGSYYSGYNGVFLNLDLSFSSTIGSGWVTNAAAYLAGDTIVGVATPETITETCTPYPPNNPYTTCERPHILELVVPFVDTMTGTLTFYFAPLTTADTTPTPEPTTIVLFGSALACLALIRKRSRRQV
jgi:hypothetical protein